VSTGELKIEDLRAGIPGREILQGLSLTVRSGEVHAVMGPNGSGKSTLAHVLMGRPGYEILGGKVTLDGIDLFCANAGIARAGGADATEPDWDASWQVNVMAHVRAARLLTGPWLEQGQGHLICTVSAAGLLTMLGSAPYSVTKHAALAFAEWMSVTYAHRGITVQALCPQGVRTPLYESSGPIGHALMDASAITPDAAADAVIEGIADGRFLILPHPEVAGMYGRRATDPDRWLNGMNRLQQQVENLPDQ